MLLPHLKNDSVENKDPYRVIGLMSGTSLDGVDIAFCTFRKENGHWSYQIEKGETIPYSGTWKSRLSLLEKGSSLEFVRTDIEYGRFLGRITSDFISKHGVKPDFIASHGHTIFHQPGSGITSQIGKGSEIAAMTGRRVICDFRSTDVALGGEGAPLVPVGDRMLFGEYDYCLNLGGFANISYEESGSRIAFDICPANIVLNQLASLLNKPYDENGLLASRGNLNEQLLDELNRLEYYQKNPPKSLGKEWVLATIDPIIARYSVSTNDLLRTFSEHIAVQVGNAIRHAGKSRMLITGGGAFNVFLVERIRLKSGATVILPDPLTINFKEALIFAFLGVMRCREEINCLASSTGASRDSAGGSVYLGNS